MSNQLRKVRVGIVGTGFIGQVHIDAYRQNPFCDLVAICDNNEPRLREVQQQFGIAQGYTDQYQMYERENLDGVVIATPDEYHLQPVQAAAAAGVNIMLEKPIATTIADAEKIIEATEKAGVKLMLGFTLRFIPHYAAIHDKVASGALGTPTNAYARRSCRYSEARRLYGRCSVNQYLAVHDIDTILWNFGREVESVYTTAGNFVISRELNTPDYFWNIIKFKNGATATIHATWSEPDAYRNYVEMELLLNGEKGSAHLLLAGSQISFSSNELYETPEVSLAATYPAEATHFIDCLRLDRKPIVGGQEGLDALKILLAADESVARGLPAKVSL